MKYSLSNIIKDLLAKIPVLENRINTLSTKITNINNNSVVKKVSNSAPEGNTLTLVEGAVETDAFRIIVGDEGKDNLYVSFDTCDNSNEKIQFRQYGNAIYPYGIFNGTPIRTAVILGRNGETTFPVSVTAPKFVGSLQGNAGSANVGKALQVFDGNNNAINSTFHWVGQNGQPEWLWGSNDGSNAFVYNPANFWVSHATNADSATTAATADRGNWQGKNDNRWYQMAFSLGNEFNWNSNNAFQYNPASNVLKVDTVQGNITGNASTATNANHANSADSASSVAWGNISGKPSTFAPSTHWHSWDATTSKPTGIVKVASWDGSTLSLTTVT